MDNFVTKCPAHSVLNKLGQPWLLLRTTASLISRDTINKSASPARVQLELSWRQLRLFTVMSRNNAGTSVGGFTEGISRTAVSCLFNTGLFEMIVGGLTTNHTKYARDTSMCFFLFNRTTLQVFVTYLTGALYVHPLWFYRHQHDNRVLSKLYVASDVWLAVHRNSVWIRKTN